MVAPSPNKPLPKDILEKVRQVEVRTRRLVSDSLAGSYQAVFKGHGMNFDEVREYVPGDDIRTIDWNVTARTSIPHVKKFKEERELTILLMIDISGSHSFGSGQLSKRELMAELGAVLAFSAVRSNDKVGLLLLTDQVELYVPPQKGRGHILRLIREVLFFTPKGQKTDLGKGLDFIARVLKRRAVLFLISDFCLTPDFSTTLENLKVKLQAGNRRHDLIAVSVSDPREHELPDIGWLTLEDAETGQQLEINTGDPETRRRFSLAARDRQLQLQRVLRGAGIDQLQLTTDSPYLPALRSFFAGRQARRH